MSASGMSVVIPTWRRAPWLDKVLGGLLSQTRLPDEVVVVGRREDAAARDVAAARAASTPFPVRWVEVDRPGHVAPVLRGLREVSTEFVAFLDDDTEPQEGWLAAITSPFDDERVACVGGRVVTPGLQAIVHPDAGCIRWYGRFVGNVAAREGEHAVEVDGVPEGNSMWRASVLRAIWFDPVLDFHEASMYGLDLTLQTKELGYRVLYEPRARVLNHEAPRDPALDKNDRLSRTFPYSRNYTYLGLKHYRGLRRVGFVLWWWGAGERHAYGVLKAVSDFPLRGRRVLRQAGEAYRGRAEGLRLWRATRR